MSETDVATATPTGEEPVAPTKYNIGGAEYEQTELEALVSKGIDYTKKTQTLAEERRALELEKLETQQLALIKRDWSDPSKQRAIVESMAREAGINISDVRSASKPPNWDEMTATEQSLFTMVQRLEADKNNTIEQTSKQLSAIQDELKKVTERDKLDLAIVQAQEAIQNDFSLKIPIEDIKKAVAETGVTDPEAAVLKFYKKRISDHQKKVGAAAKVEDKPQSPGSGTKTTFDPYDPNMSHEQVMSHLAAGHVPIERATKVNNWRNP